MPCCIASAWVALLIAKNQLLHESAWVALLVITDSIYRRCTDHLLVDRSPVSQGSVALHHASAASA